MSIAGLPADARPDSARGCRARTSAPAPRARLRASSSPGEPGVMQSVASYFLASAHFDSDNGQNAFSAGIVSRTV